VLFCVVTTMHSDMCQKQNPDQEEIFFETLKNRFLAAVYRQDPQQARQAYLLILEHTEQVMPNPGETREKMLRQVQTAFLRFKPFLTSSDTRLSSSFERMKTLLTTLAKSGQAGSCHVSCAQWESGLNLAPWQMDQVFKNAVTVQLTSGCTLFCRRCNEWALPGIRAHFSFKAAQTILDRLKAQKNLDAALYGASDPLDWEHGSNTLADLLAPHTADTCFSLLTKVPRNRHPVLMRLIQQGIALSVSVTDKNRGRISALEAGTGIRFQKQHDSDDLLIPAGLDEDFSSVKSSITDAYGTEITPEGAFIIIPSFTSALHPMGHKKLPVTRKTAVFPVKKIGRQALLVDYFKPLEVVGQENKPFHLSRLLDIQVETLLLDNGSMDLSPPGMRNLKEYFTIFEDPARIRRKQMMPSIVKGLKKEVVSDGSYRDLTVSQKQRFRQKIAVHVVFCKKKAVTESRRCAAAFLLGSALDYLDGHENKKTIIAHLIETEAGRLENRYGRSAGVSDPEQMFSEHPDQFFDIFRFYATALVFDRHRQQVSRFVQAHPAIYDPLADRFSPAPRRSSQ
jgi:hypothetical protein